MVEAKAVAKAIKASEFNMFEELRQLVDDAGAVDVPLGYDGYVIYGPYWPMAPGHYLVEPDIYDADANEVIGVLEICDKGVVLAWAELKARTVLTAQLPRIEGLEIRIKAAGLPFKLRQIVLAHLPDPSAAPPADIAQGLLALGEVEVRLKELDSPGQDTSYGQLVAREQRPLGSSYELLYQLVNGTADVGLACEISTDLNFENDFETWLSGTEPELVIEAWGDKLQHNASDLIKHGFDLSALLLTRSDSHGLGVTYAEAAGDIALAEKLRHERDNPPTPFQSEWLNLLRRAQGYFAKSAIASGYAVVTCPYTGELVKSSHAIPAPTKSCKQVFMFYRFVSIKTFYVIVGSFSAGKSYLYVPGDKLIVELAPPTFQWGAPVFSVGSFRRWVVQHAIEVCEYLSKPTRTCTLVGTIDNLGHFFWNEVSGLLSFEAKGFIPSDVAHALGNYPFIDPYKLLSVESSEPSLAFADESALFLGILRQSLFCVRPAECAISREMADSLRKFAWSAASDDLRGRIEDASACDFLLWAGVRAHNKVWVNQIEGLTAVVEELTSRYNSVAVYVDGTPDCADLLEALRRRFSRQVKIFSGISVPITETLLWVFEIDAYVTTIGSGLTLPTWVGAKPGVAHSEMGHLHQMAFWGEVRADAPLPKTPNKEQIEELGASGYCDYVIAPEVILQLFRELLPSSPASVERSSRIASIF